MKCVQCHKELIPLHMINTITNNRGEKLTESDTIFAEYCDNDDDHERNVDVFSTQKIRCPLYHVLQIGE